MLQALAHTLFAPHTAPATRETADVCLKVGLNAGSIGVLAEQLGILPKQNKHCQHLFRLF